MNKRLGASLVAGSALAAGLVATAPAANAATCTGSYPPGQLYSLARVPFSGEVAKGAIVGTRGTLRRGGQACSGYTLAFYRAYAGQSYRLAGRGVTSSTGSVRVSTQVNVTQRFFYNLNLGGGTSVRSGITQLKAI